jgi:hypothetical protein
MAGSASWLAKDLDAVSAWASDYATGTGERRVFTLPDGSLMQLNTCSAVDLAFIDRQRLVRLKHGELMINCNPRHPCWYKPATRCWKASKDALWPIRIATAHVSASATAKWRYTGLVLANFSGSKVARTGAWMLKVRTGSRTWRWMRWPGLKG